MGFLTLASRSPQTIRPAWGDRKLIGRPRMADSSQTPPKGYGHRRAAQGAGDQLGQGGLAAAGRPGEAQDRGPGGRPGGAYDETAQRDRGRALPATGPGTAGGALQGPRHRRQPACGQEPADARLDLRAAGVGRFQVRHRRFDVDPFGRPRRPGQVGHDLQPFQ